MHSPTICRARRQKPCLNSQPAASPARRSLRWPQRIHSIIPMPSVDSASWETWRSCNARFDFPWEKWTVFLHPEQRQWVERDYAGPARVSGSAGTGKTIVALHRAVHLARKNPNARVLLTTFSDTLANALQTKLHRLVSNEPRLAERIDVYSLDAIGLRLYKSQIGAVKLAGREDIGEILKTAAAAIAGHKFSRQFLLTEWEQIVDAWQLENWESYRDVARLGRKTRLREAQRQAAVVHF